jgi:hypothetical protein
VQTSEEEMERYRAKVSELTTEKGAWERVERQMKDKIHKMQQDYYQAQLR